MMKTNKFFKSLANSLFLLSLSFGIGAETIDSNGIEPLANIRQAAENFAASFTDPSLTTQITVGNLDPRLRLPACANALEGFSPSRNQRLGRATVGIRCNSPSAWTIYVPVTLSAFTDVVALNGPVQRGETITAAHLSLTHANLSDLSQGYFLSPNDIIGKQAKRNMRAGDILTPSAIQSARLVNSGDIVTLVANTGTLSVRMQGQALKNGAAGDVVDVRNSSSKRVVRGKVTGEGLVEINP